MEQLEYYNINLSIAYPFADTTTVPFPSNWFADIIFYDANNVQYVYLNSIVTTLTTTTLVFSSQSAVLITAVFPIASIVNNALLSNAPFLTASGTNCYVRIVFGPGFPTTVQSNTYTSSQTTLSSGALVILPPLVTQINWKTYDLGAAYSTTPSSQPPLRFGTNLICSSTGTIDCIPGQGLGLYNACSATFPTTDLYYINDVGPNLAGNLSLTTDQCYTTRLFDTSLETTYGSQIVSTIPLTNLLGHSLFIQNNCTPKCTADSLNAFAYYLNRVNNGVQDLFLYLGSPYQTAGTGNLTTGPTFTASSFSSTYPGQSGFVNYFHEGKQIIFSVSGNPTTYTFTILTVNSTNEITFTNSSTVSLSGATFVVTDLGLYEELNDAIINYNSNQGSTLNQPYGLIEYTTFNGTDSFGNYGTYISLVCTIFNPSITTMSYVVNISTGGTITVPASERIVYGNNTTYGSHAGNVVCKLYATYENLYFVYCGSNSATVAVNITYVWGTVSGNLRNGTETINITSAACPPVITSAANVHVAVGGNFHYTLTGSGSGTVVYQGLPSWAAVDTNFPPSGFSIHGTVTDTTHTVYTVEMIITNTTGAYTTFTLTINVLAIPTVTVASQTGQIGSPFFSTPSITNNPVSYALIGTLPSGLFFDTTTGIISGTPSEVGVFIFQESGTNIAGTGTSGYFDITINDQVPVVTSTTVGASQGSNFIYAIQAANYPTSYGATGLPAGLILNSTTGIIYGAPENYGTTSVPISATNTAGTGTGTLVINTAIAPPIITSANYAAAFPGVAFTYIITAINNVLYYSAGSLPSWLTLTGNTLSGTPTTAGAITVIISATNALSSTAEYLAINVVSTTPGTSAPTINSSTTVSGTHNVLFNYYITANQNPTAYSATGLPSWATINITNGLIYGVPTNPGTYSGILLYASNAIGTSSPISLTITIV